MTLYSAPAATDAFSRTLVKGYKESDVADTPKGFQSLFPMGGGTTQFSDSAYLVDVDIKRANRKHAKLILRGTTAKNSGIEADQNNDKFTNVSLPFGLMEEEIDIPSTKLQLRGFDQARYGDPAQMMILRDLAREGHYEGMRRMIIANERLAAQSILNAEQDVIFGTANAALKYDYQRNSNNEITVTTEWDNSGDPLTDLKTASQAVYENGFMAADCVIMGEDALNAFLDNTIVKNRADNRRISLIEVTADKPVPQHLQFMVDNGFTPYGQLVVPGWFRLWIFTYHHRYQTDAGTLTPYMPVDEALVFSSAARTNRYFGPRDQNPMTSARRQYTQEILGFDPSMPQLPPDASGGVIVPASFYTDVRPTLNEKGIVVRVQNATVFHPIAVDAFAKLDGLIV